MSEPKSRTTKILTQTFQLAFAALMGAFAAKVLEPYWDLSDWGSKFIFSAIILLGLLAYSLLFTGFVHLLEWAFNLRKKPKTPKSTEGKNQTVKVAESKPKREKQDAIRWWQTKYTWVTILTVIIAFIFPLLMWICTFYGFASVLNYEMLIGFLAVEATITGFFGLIFVHGLATFISTFDILARGLERQLDKKKETEADKREGREYFVGWNKAHTATTNNRTMYIKHSLVTGGVLIFSMLSVIIALTFTLEWLVFYFSYFSIGLLLFVCLPQILWAMNDLGKDPYHDWTEAILNRTKSTN
jgi:hypothetical protein